MSRSGIFKKPAYKIKLNSGRVLGPLDLERIRLFIKRNKINGTELAREHPKGHWQDINSITEIAELFLEKVQADFPDSGKSKISINKEDPIANAILNEPTAILADVLPGATAILGGTDLKSLPQIPELPIVPRKPKKVEAPELPELPEVPNVPREVAPPPPPAPTDEVTGPPPPVELTRMEAPPLPPVPEKSTEKKSNLLGRFFGNLKYKENTSHRDLTSALAASALARVLERPRTSTDVPTPESLKLSLEEGTATGVSPVEQDDIATRIASLEEEEESSYGVGTKVLKKGTKPKKGVKTSESKTKKIANEKTILLNRFPDQLILPSTPKVKKKLRPRDFLRVILIAGLLGEFGYESFLADPVKGPPAHLKPVKPELPNYVKGKSDAHQSAKVYNDAMRYYVADTVMGYRQAADLLRVSAGADINNVKALAMLASSYLNLIDSSNKDENYFSVMSKLIDMSRAKAVDLPETTIANAEFFLVVNKAEAAQNLIADYTKNHPNGYGSEMFYYFALTFFARGDAASAARYLAYIPDTKAFSAKIFYLRGMVAEKLKDSDTAMTEYQKAIKFNPEHAKSRLRISEILNKQGEIKATAKHLEFLMAHANLLAPRDLGLAYYLHAQVLELDQKPDIALGDIERAVKLDPENHDYILELYTLRARAGDSIETDKKQARMYYYLGEGEKLIQLGRYQEALIPLLQARQANDDSSLPPVKIGDMFTYLHDVENAKINYKIASEKERNNIKVWSKYINSLIQSYEWDEASKAMDKFRKLDVSQSAIDKAAADMYEKQGKYVEAQTFYKKAMARDSIDPDVYIAYGKSLMATKNFKDAPFFFALGLRLDPLNVDAVIQTAKCVSETESIDRGISFLQDELQKGKGARSEYLAAIAEFQIQRGAWDQALQSINLATQADPEYAYPWKLQAQYYMNREGQDKDALDRALFAYKSYSERNPSDPSGYLERYRIFIKKTDYEKAKEELNRIYEIYPRYPNLHYYLGALYSIQGNHKIAAEEFKIELGNNASNPQTLIAYGKELLDSELPAEALTQFNRAMAILPTSAEAKQNAGWASYKLKNFQAAVVLIKSAISIDKGNPTYYKRLGLVQREMGDTGSACGSFRKYLEMEPDASDKGDYSGC